MKLALTTAFTTIVTSAAADGSQLSVDQTTIQNLLNLQTENTFYHPGAGLRIDEQCAVKGDNTVCEMQIINGKDLRVLGVEGDKLKVTYHSDGENNLTGISVEGGKGQFYSGSGSGGQDNIAEGEQYDERMKEVSIAYNRGMYDQAKENGFKTPQGYIQNKDRLKEYKTENGIKTAIGQALLKEGESEDSKFIYGRTFQPLDRITFVEDNPGNSFSETSCKLIPIAGAQPKNYDIDMSESARALCVTKEFNLGADVVMTYNIYGLTNGGELQQASFTDTRKMGSMPGGVQDMPKGDEDKRGDIGRYAELRDEVGKVSGNETNVVNHAPPFR